MGPRFVGTLKMECPLHVSKFKPQFTKEAVYIQMILVICKRITAPEVV
jgi:hypothetical protein